jgi:hypothetical protein
MVIRQLLQLNVSATAEHVQLAHATRDPASERNPESSMLVSRSLRLTPLLMLMAYTDSVAEGVAAGSVTVTTTQSASAAR